MKRPLLNVFLLVLLVNFLLQSSHGQNDLLNRIEKIPAIELDPMGGISPGIKAGNKLSGTVIGNTNYDLQTYNSIEQRTFAYPDGTVAATWMMAFETDWPDRGIGYNYFDGISWGEAPTESIASIRTGWASYTPLGENGEIAVGHANDNDEWVLWFCKRADKGTGEWEEFTLGGPESGVGIVWPAITSGGEDHNTLHVLGLTYGNEYMGQGAALLYSRSQDGGETWDIENHFFEDIGPDYFTSVGAETYTWAAPKGNTIAFTVGFGIGHGCIMKSNDNGDTWEFIEVYNSPAYPPTGDYTLPFGAGDGTSASAIDNDGNVHVVFGRMVHVYDETGAAFYYPSTDGLIYWNETMPPLDTATISSSTLEHLEENGNLIGYVIGDGIPGLIDFATYYTSLTSHPQIMIDGMNRVFVLYAGVAPDFNNGAYNFRHIYGNSSSDGGATWNGIEDLTDELLYIFSECIYPNIAPHVVDGKIHFTFQDDDEPGIFVWAGSQAEVGSNNISYMSIETDELTGIGDAPASEVAMEVSQNYPNPFLDVTYLEVNTPLPSGITFTVSDIAGRVVHSENIEKTGSEKHRIRFNSQGLTSGVYYYTVRSDFGSFSGKMIVQ